MSNHHHRFLSRFATPAGLPRWSGLFRGLAARRKPSHRQRGLRVEPLEPRLLLMGGNYAYGSNPMPVGALAPDFALVDVNATSSTYNQTISPRDYLDRVSVWLFGWAT